MYGESFDSAEETIRSLSVETVKWTEQVRGDLRDVLEQMETALTAMQGRPQRHVGKYYHPEWHHFKSVPLNREDVSGRFIQKHQSGLASGSSFQNKHHWMLWMQNALFILCSENLFALLQRNGKRKQKFHLFLETNEEKSPFDTKLLAKEDSRQLFHWASCRTAFLSSLFSPLNPTPNIFWSFVKVSPVVF